MDDKPLEVKPVIPKIITPGPKKLTLKLSFHSDFASKLLEELKLLINSSTTRPLHATMFLADIIKNIEKNLPASTPIILSPYQTKS